MNPFSSWSNNQSGTGGNNFWGGGGWSGLPNFNSGAGAWGDLVNWNGGNNNFNAWRGDQNQPNTPLFQGWQGPNLGAWGNLFGMLAQQPNFANTPGIMNTPPPATTAPVPTPPVPSTDFSNGQNSSLGVPGNTSSAPPNNTQNTNFTGLPNTNVTGMGNTGPQYLAQPPANFDSSGLLQLSGNQNTNQFPNTNMTGVGAGVGGAGSGLFGNYNRGMISL